MNTTFDLKKNGKRIGTNPEKSGGVRITFLIQVFEKYNKKIDTTRRLIQEED